MRDIFKSYASVVDIGGKINVWIDVTLRASQRANNESKLAEFFGVYDSSGLFFMAQRLSCHCLKSACKIH